MSTRKARLGPALERGTASPDGRHRQGRAPVHGPHSHERLFFMRSFLLGIVAGTIAIGGHVALGAQVHISQVADQGVARNDLPVDVFVLLYSPSARRFVTLRVPSHGRVPVPFGDARKLSEEPVAVDVSRRAVFRSCTVAPAAQTDLAQITRELRDLDLLESASGQARVQAASDLAQLELAQHYDEQSTYRNDPLRNELRRQQDRNVPVELGLARQRDEALQGLASDVTQRALAWADVQQERLAVIRDQLHTLRPLVEQAQLALRIHEQEILDYRRTVDAWQAFSRAVASALDARPLPLDESRILPAKPVKFCDGPSAAWDVFQIDGPDRDRVSVVMAEISFNRGGGKQLTHLRRLGTTQSWSGRLDWPEVSSSASIRLRWPGTKRWYAMSGGLDAQRPSMRTSLGDVRRAAAAVEENLDDTNFRAAGGDVIKTVPIF